MRATSFVYCNVAVDLPRDVYRHWSPYIDWARKVIVAEEADEVILELHWHPDTWKLGCGFMGMHNSDTMEMHFCGHKAPSKITILHEIAHLLAPAKSGHDRKWAASLLALNLRWLPARRALRANRTHAQSYRSFRAVWRNYSGVAAKFTGFPKHSHKVSRTRWK